VTFRQSPPELGDQYADDAALRGYLRATLPADVLQEVEPELRELGALSGGPWYRMQQEDRLEEPRLTQWDPWGERIDRIDATRVWRQAERAAAERGIVATAYEQKHGRFSRIHQFALAYLFAPSTDVYACPLAMTDGAARTLLDSGNTALIERAVPRLTSRDPARFWTSGQWMTETTGGSDVGLSETVARRDADGAWRLHGVKWFTSAAASQMALTLARPEGNGPGGRGLALFYLEPRDEAGRLQGIRIRRLKDKLGTRKLPTAELELDGAPATPVGELRDGVRAIAPMLNLTRTWNAVSAIAFMRRGLALATDYAHRRVAFGRPLAELPLHADTLRGLEAEFRGALLLTVRVAELIGVREAGEGGEDTDRLLRILTPIAKLTTARQAVAVVAECMEALGGAGYVEDTGLPALLRDTHVLPIWEGTTNVLALEALRALGGGDGAALLREEARTLAGAAREPRLARVAGGAMAALDRALARAAEGGEGAEAGARRIALAIGFAMETLLLAAHAQRALDDDDDPLPAGMALRFAAERAGI
jgi:acyl-CoA dehydrogenase